MPPKADIIEEAPLTEAQMELLIFQARERVDAIHLEMAPARELLKQGNKKIANVYRELKNKCAMDRKYVEMIIELSKLEEARQGEALTQIRRAAKALHVGEQGELLVAEKKRAEVEAKFNARPADDPHLMAVFDHGVTAAKAGKGLDACPERPNSKAAKVWESGHLAGQAELALEMHPVTGTTEPTERRPGQPPVARASLERLQPGA